MKIKVVMCNSYKGDILNKGGLAWIIVTVTSQSDFWQTFV